MSASVEEVFIRLDNLHSILDEISDLRKENADLKALILAAPSSDSVLILSKNDQAQLLTALDNPPEPTDALRRTFDRSGVDTPITKHERSVEYLQGHRPL